MEDEREMTAPPVMAGHEGPARIVAADAPSIARANLMNAQVQTQEPGATDVTSGEYDLAQGSALPNQNSTGWPITRPVLNIGRKMQKNRINSMARAFAANCVVAPLSLV